MLNNSLVMLAWAQPTPMPRAVASANYNQIARTSLSILLAREFGKCRSHVPVGSAIVFRAPHLFFFAGEVDSRIADLLNAGGPPTSRGSWCRIYRDRAFRRVAHTVWHGLDGGLVEWQMDPLTERLPGEATRLCRRAVKQDVARTHLWQCALPSGHTYWVHKHLPANKKGQLGQFE